MTIGTIGVLAGLIAVVGVIVAGMISDRKKGKSSCTGNCSSCGGHCSH
ncbi:MAG TPA: FeoB-associated Cys-rich membrane protein [Bacteroides sp.]|jgi:FtsZ-interacting cell division protein ZipA|nr:FeoB-associated Cys-rich membrane protein [Bacteroides sp.]